MNDENKLEGWHPVVFFNEKNLNGRIYTKDSITEDALDKMNNKIKNKQCLGELGHPETFDVSMSNISHAIEKIDVKDNIMFAKIRTLSTPNGEVLKNTIQHLGNESIVFRPRASGNVNEDGTVNIKELFSFDAINAADDSFKDMQDRYNEMLKSDLNRSLDEIDKSYRKNPEAPEEQ